MQDVIVAALVLEIDRNVVGLMAFAAPSGIRHRSAMRASAAVGELGWLGLVAKAMRWAKAALIPGWIGAYRLRHPVS